MDDVQIKNAINSKIAWCIVLVPIIGAVIELITWQNLWWLYLTFNIVLCFWDEKRLKAAGFKAPTTLWVFLIPIYLWQRSNLLKVPQYHAIAWIIAFVLSFGITSWGKHTIIEESACPVVTQILKSNYQTRALSCKSLTVDSEIKNGLYSAHSILNNGTELRVMIEVKNNGQIEVTVPPQYNLY